MYFIYGDENFLIWNKIKKLIKHSKETITFNEDENVYAIFNELESYDLFTNEKIIIIKNHWLLKKDDKKLTDFFINILENLNEKYQVIFVIESDKINRKNSLVNFLIKNANVFKMDKYNSKDLSSVAKKIVISKGGTIEREAAIELVMRVPNELRIIVQEIDKILLLNKNITKEIVLSEVSNYYESDSFGLVNAINELDFNKIYQTLINKIINYEDINQLVGQISANLNLALIIYTNVQLGKNLKSIEKKYNIHHFRLQKANTFLKNIGHKNLMFLIAKTAQLDYDIKNGNVNDIIGIKNLILDFFKLEINL